MTEKSTFIKLNRKILKWRWYQDANTFRLFIHLLLKANITDREFENVTVKRGQLITSQKHLSQQLDISTQAIRTAINHLKLTGEITVETTSKYSIITIINYNEYQKVTRRLTGEQQAANRQSTGEQQQYKNDKECKRMIKNEREVTHAPLGRFKNVILTQSELDELKAKFPNDYEAKIERLSRYQKSKGKKYDSHFATLLDWLEKDTANTANNDKDEQKVIEKKQSKSYDIDKLEQITPLKFGTDYD